MKKRITSLAFSCDGITSVEYAIIGVCMSVSLLYILDSSSFLQTLNETWIDMARSVNSSLNG
ncbi:hypothetical protein ACOMICROBIO_NCLOACGD_04103 [Vibrio sp. B1ASS3]|nr:hypothetical protein ACOMICROBIO_NCLOACGD_04103 [Vibrio sp. B1ASS3]CAE6946841.1 hypothetical protein ACOMICROBIO_NCLOACGD_04103 [Vibrio sp. B1ASS3]